MPVVSRTQRAEAKYNVTLDFPHLGLHSAASSGNLGLVTYALDHGQPVNSVLDGVLPLHVACSGGNDLVVRLLINRGADVNAPRDASAPIVGTSGATPLHFAAANGHEHVVLTLLLHGAHPDRPDKHGVTAEGLARQNGYARCAELLSKWSHEKDKDLREREVLHVPSPDPEPSSRLDNIECKVHEKKLKVKRSIDNAFHMLRPAPTPPSGGTIPQEFAGDVGSSDSSPATSTAQEFPPRRPSLPHIFDSPSQSTSQYPTQSSNHPPHRSSRQASVSHCRRPRSAGTDADQSGSPAVSTVSTPGRLRGKLSLLHMFKKAAGESSSSTPGAPPTPEGKESLSGYASSSSPMTSASASPAPDRERERSRGSSSSHSPLKTRASESGLLPSAASSPFPPVLSTVPSSRSRLRSESEASVDASYPPLAVELHRKLSAERMRGRSSSTSLDTNKPLPSPQNAAHRSPQVRPGILRPHARSASSGQTQFQPPIGLGLRSALGLETSDRGSSGRDSPSISHQRSRTADLKNEESDYSQNRHATVLDDEDADEADDDFEPDGYGEVISPRLGLGIPLAPESKTRLHELKSEARTLERRPSNGSQRSRASSNGSLPSPTTANDPAGYEFDCPFSINRPPPEPLPVEQSVASTSDSRLQPSHGIDNRVRGDSFGSISTSTEASMPETPGPGPSFSPHFLSPDSLPLDLPLDATSVEDEKARERDHLRQRTNSSVSGGSANYFGERERSPARTLSPSRAARHVPPPLDIDIRAISSHAQAEALVARAQKSIMDMSGVELDVPAARPSSTSTIGADGALTPAPSSGALPSGRTPLSARLAAYGEVLALERRFKEKERQGTGASAELETPVGSPTTPSQARTRADPLRPRASEFDVRKFSLEERPMISAVPASKRGKGKRHTPQTVSDSSSEAQSGFLRQPVSPGHKPTLSGSQLLSPRGQFTASRAPLSTKTLPQPPPPRIVRSRTPDPEGCDLSSSRLARPRLERKAVVRSPALAHRHGAAAARVAGHRRAADAERAGSPARAREKADEDGPALARLVGAVGAGPPRSNGGAATPFSRNGGGAPSGRRFGGIKGLVQTLTGKATAVCVPRQQSARLLQEHLLSRYSCHAELAATIRDWANTHDHALTLMANAVAHRAPHDHTLSLFNPAQAGTVLTAEDFVRSNAYLCIKLLDRRGARAASAPPSRFQLRAHAVLCHGAGGAAPPPRMAAPRPAERARVQGPWAHAAPLGFLPVEFFVERLRATVVRAYPVYRPRVGDALAAAEVDVLADLLHTFTMLLADGVGPPLVARPPRGEGRRPRLVGGAVVRAGKRWIYRERPDFDWERMRRPEWQARYKTSLRIDEMLERTWEMLEMPRS
ncbi:uncharacterized protein BXZ73DRAFT_106947 [Epithele typhae]|uniref:uncharacterized protein n=1 Tax=Epithele typhae TaxID=378194 RepID=UPI002007E653|nr:uncharacterized protein BXZ73DRAFT_106947 [Epithele typhae]KAH9913473.1 hypothetical protein BXZ73DRAFT_106947 [Epithele typhae]